LRDRVLTRHEPRAHQTGLEPAGYGIATNCRQQRRFYTTSTTGSSRQADGSNEVVCNRENTAAPTERRSNHVFRTAVQPGLQDYAARAAAGAKALIVLANRARVNYPPFRVLQTESDGLPSSSSRRRNEWCVSRRAQQMCGLPCDPAPQRHPVVSARKVMPLRRWSIMTRRLCVLVAAVCFSSILLILRNLADPGAWLDPLECSQVWS